MNGYRTYRGLHGETIRVPEHTIAPAPYLHCHEPFPYAAIARELDEEKRDRFAAFAQFKPWIEDALAPRKTRHRAG
ncbi:hypothetical protein [Tsuneonella mangrovi]|uniref:hypothetical protein n=1 Tax=Tsuneonella mangrovi TaxID=1982042 RepID=UPI000BA1F2A8|nr:hypothetical protein [Tsuneonella mangrovi]